MAWDFSLEPEFETKLRWARSFVDDEVAPLDALFPGCEFLPLDDERRSVVDPLKQRVRDEGLWAAHLPPELGGQGFGVLRLAFLNEILGRVGPWASIVFGTQAPDTGNAEILARFGTEDQKRRYLQPLLDGEIFSCFSMTEPQGGADPSVFTTRAIRDGDEWLIQGDKFFSSNASVASFLIVMAVTNPDVEVHRGTSMFLVPASTPGVRIVQNHLAYGDPEWASGHAHVRYEDVRVPAEAMLGAEGDGFLIAQSRLAGGRIHHAMRAVGQCQVALDMMCERALSRYTKGSTLADKQFVQGFIADSFAELMQFRLAVRYAAWLIDDRGEEHARQEIATLKVVTPKVVQNILGRAIQVHGALGVSDELLLVKSMLAGIHLGIADGPTEVHKVSLARRVLRDYEPVDGHLPSLSRTRMTDKLVERYGNRFNEFPVVPAAYRR